MPLAVNAQGGPWMEAPPSCSGSPPAFKLAANAPTSGGRGGHTLAPKTCPSPSSCEGSPLAGHGEGDFSRFFRPSRRGPVKVPASVRHVSRPREFTCPPPVRSPGRPGVTAGGVPGAARAGALAGALGPRGPGGPGARPGGPGTLEQPLPVECDLHRRLGVSDSGSPLLIGA